MSNADDYNRNELESGRLRLAHVTELVARFQRAQGLPVDGKAGPTTRAVLELMRGKEPGSPPQASTRETIVGLPVLEVRQGWLVGERVTVIPSHASWYYDRMATIDGNPGAIVAHYTATDPGTAVAMARHRARKFVNGTDRAASWHVSIEADGAIVQMVPFTAGCWHAGGKTAKPIAGLGSANRTSVGVELVGYGDKWPPTQVAAAARVWRALVLAYAIPRERAMVTHQELDPTRKRDPGQLWMSSYASGVLDYTYSTTRLITSPA